jgi:hypothetical protein
LFEKLEYAEGELQHYKGLYKEIKLEKTSSEMEVVKHKTRAE